MTVINIDVSENVTAALDRAIAFGDDLTPAMKAISQMMVSFSQFNFLKQSNPQDVPWKRRVPHPGKVDFPHPILQKSGDLFDSLREDYSATHAAAGPEASGGAAIYARIHQLGGTIRPRADNKKNALNTPFGLLKSVTIPARAYLGWNDRMSGRAVDILEAFIRGVFADRSTALQER